MSTRKALLIAWFVVGVAALGAAYAVTFISMPAYSATENIN